jgi:hypothetical protein
MVGTADLLFDVDNEESGHSYVPNLRGESDNETFVCFSHFQVLGLM